MTLTLLKRHRTLLKSFLHLEGIPVSSLVSPGLLSMGAAHHMVNGHVNSNGGTLLAFREALNAKLERLGKRPVTLAGLRYMLEMQPAPTEPREQLRAIEKARRL